MKKRMSGDTRDALGILLAIVVFWGLRISLELNTAFSILVALGAGLALVFVLSKQEKK